MNTSTALHYCRCKMYLAFDRHFACFLVQVRVEVIDTNDSPPVFDAAMTKVVSVAENTRVSSRVTQINATDPDSVGTLEFTIINGANGKFAIEPITGIE